MFDWVGWLGDEDETALRAVRKGVSGLSDVLLRGIATNLIGRLLLVYRRNLSTPVPTNRLNRLYRQSNRIPRRRGYTTNPPLRPDPPRLPFPSDQLLPPSPSTHIFCSPICLMYCISVLTGEGLPSQQNVYRYVTPPPPQPFASWRQLLSRYHTELTSHSAFTRHPTPTPHRRDLRPLLV